MCAQYDCLEKYLSGYVKKTTCAKKHLLISGVYLGVEKITSGKQKLVSYILNAHKYQPGRSLSAVC
jgi:hypothetical protein